METVLANLLTAPGKLRAATLNGRDYLVAPVTMVVPGVLDGSEGPGLYTDEENAKSLDRWNGVPLVAYHPTDESGNISSARDPAILDRSGMGWVFRTSNGGKLSSEAWFDIDWTKRVDASLVENGLDPSKQVLPRLQKGEPVEVSTGLKVTKVPAPEGSTLNGVGYKWVARDYEPDHLAVLPDIKGACSIDHGCGLLVNELVDGLSSEENGNVKLLLWQQIGNLLGINCGGPGGTPGPCASGSKEGGGGKEGGKYGHAAVRERVEGAKTPTDKLKALHQSAADIGDVALVSGKFVDSAKTLENDVNEVMSGMKSTEIKAAAKELGINRPLSSEATKQAIRDKIVGKFGSYVRAKEAEDPKKVKKEAAQRISSAARNSSQGDNDMASQNEGRSAAFDKKKTIDFIVGNCNCWKDPNDVDILNGFSDGKLLKLKEDINNKLSMKKKLAANTLAAMGVNILNAEGEGEGTNTEVAPGVSIADLAEYLGIVADPGQDPAGYIKELLDSIDLVRKKIAGEATPPPPAVEEVAAMDAGGTGDGTPKEATGNRQRPVPRLKQSLSQWEADMPEAARDVWNRAKKVAANARKSIINQLLRHVSKDRKEAFAKKLAGKKIHELEDMLDLVGTREQSSSRAGNRRAAPPPEEEDGDGDEGDDDTSSDLYFPVGRQGRVAANDSSDMEELQPGPVMNWGQRNGTTKS